MVSSAKECCHIGQLSWHVLFSTLCKVPICLRLLNAEYVYLCSKYHVGWKHHRHTQNSVPNGQFAVLESMTALCAVFALLRVHFGIKCLSSTSCISVMCAAVTSCNCRPLADLPVIKPSRPLAAVDVETASPGLQRPMFCAGRSCSLSAISGLLC